jgi:short subunit dehydrogenase-like uncharacterized protein
MTKSRRTPASVSSTKTAADVVLYGATGYTGHLAARAMERAGVSMVLAGRNRESLGRMAREFDEEHPVAVARHDDPKALGELASMGKVLASTAGPFAEVGELTVAAAVAQGVHYLDSSGETEFMAQTYRRHHATARGKGIVVMNSCAFEYVIGDCAVELALEDYPSARSLRVSYWIPDKAATRGTTLSALRILFGKEGLKTRAAGRRIAFPQPAGSRWAVTYPGGETELLPRRRPDVNISTLMEVPEMVARSTALLPALATIVSFQPVQGGIRSAVRRMPEGPGPQRRARQRWMILVEVDPDDDGRRRIVVDGVDPYGLTGEILARTAARLLAGKQRAAGVLSPAQAFDPVETLDSLADLGVSWRRD